MVLVLMVVSGVARGAWFDEGWAYRRTISVDWDAERGQGTELAQARVYTAGHHAAEAKDVRVASADGKSIASEVLFVAGDRVDVVFELQKGVKEYGVYFGNAKAPDPPAELAKVKRTGGLLMETRRWDRNLKEDFKGIRDAFERSKPVLGRTVIDRPFIGFNPNTEEATTISRLVGTLNVPADGTYAFAISCDDKGAITVNEKDVAFAKAFPADTRFNGKVELKQGPTPVVIYQADYGGEMLISVGWQRPGAEKYEIVPGEAFGRVYEGTAGPLEPQKRRLVADFTVEYLGECFVGSEYAHRYKLSAVETRGVEYEWDLGDGQKRKGPTVEHVYLRPGVYPVRLRGKSKEQTDTQTTKLPVGRDVRRLDKVKEDEAKTVSKVVAGYELGAMPSAQLMRAVIVHREAKELGEAVKACAALARLAKHEDPERTMGLLTETTQEAMREGRAGAVLDLLRATPAESNLQPAAAELAAEYLMWWQGMPEGAVYVLRPLIERHPRARRTYGQALVLAGAVEQGAPMLESIEADGDPAKAAAMSGAMARSIEFYIGEKDWQEGEAQWRRWQERYPASFLEGYSVWLRVKLMEARGATAAAAQVAEDFAAAVPGSAYAPRLLHQASEWVKAREPERAAELRKVLKERYPEDPLSQD